jgi:hypothetical protein
MTKQSDRPPPISPVEKLRGGIAEARSDKDTLSLKTRDLIVGSRKAITKADTALGERKKVDKSAGGLQPITRSPFLAVFHRLRADFATTFSRLLEVPDPAEILDLRSGQVNFATATLLVR